MIYKPWQQLILTWIFCFLWFLTLMPSLTTSLAQPNKVHFERPQSARANDDQVILDITRQGSGMIFPASRQVYFRLYRSGRLEFEVSPKFDPTAKQANFELVKRETKLSMREVDELIKFFEQPDLLAAASLYSALEKEIDARMITTIVYASEGRKKQIIITNYRPENPQAGTYYPSSLKKLLSRVVELRPKTDDEIRYGWGGIY